MAFRLGIRILCNPERELRTAKRPVVFMVGSAQQNGLLRG